LHRSGRVEAANFGNSSIDFEEYSLMPSRRNTPGAPIPKFLSPFLLSLFALASLPAQQPAPASKILGTIQNISGQIITVLSDTGTLSMAAVEDSTRILQIEPGKTDLKEATPIRFSDLQTGDRVLVRGVLADDGKTIRAASVIAVKKSAIADKQAKERADWQRGVGGLVKFIDSGAQTILLTTNGFSANKEVLLHFTKDTVLRRYASDSTRFDAAKPAPASEIHSGDQLRARGSRINEGKEFDAAEIVSGTFRSIAGTIASTDAASGTLVVQDLATKSPVTLQTSPESQMRKLPMQFAEGLAMRLKNQSDGAATNGNGGAPQTAGQPAQNGQAGPGASPAGGPASGAARGGDFQQMIARMPAATIADLQKGDAVMVVTTPGRENTSLTIITLLAGVEPILRASPKGGQDMILSPWSLGGGEPSGN
jgi:hypothetical protein